MKIIHVGLGKTGTTFLQNEIFPKVAKILNIEFIDSKNFEKKYNHHSGNEIGTFHPFHTKKKAIKKFHYDDYFLSYETLCGHECNPLFWKKSAKINQKIFGKNATVLLTVADPLDFFSSLYCGMYHAYIIKNEKDFFLTHIQSQKYFKNKKDKYFVDYEIYDIAKLINIYKNLFNKVIVLKKKDIKNMKILSELFENNDIQKIKFKKVYYNRSYSKFSMKLTYIAENFLKLFNSSLYNFFNLSVRKIPNININNKLFNIINRKILYRLRYELRWRYFIQFRLDRIIPYKKFYVNKNNLKKIKLVNHKKFYENLKSSII